MNVFEVLNLRSEYEEIVLNYKVPGDKKPGTISNLKWFIQNGTKGNRFRAGFDRATEIAKTIVSDEKGRKKRK
jgi:hypothetical protein